MAEKIKPGRWRYGLAILLFLAGGFAFLVAIEGLKTGVDDLIQVVVPGETTITVSEPGDFTIFYENQSIVDGRVFSTGDLSNLNVQITSDSTGEPVEIEDSSVSTSYTVGGRSGQSIAAFSVDETGDYTLRAAYGEGTPGPEVVLAIGSGSSGGVFTALLPGAVGMLLVAAAVVIGLRTFLKPRKARRLAEGSRSAGYTEESEAPV
jgi:hypothetical protein